MKESKGYQEQPLWSPGASLWRKLAAFATEDLNSLQHSCGFTTTPPLSGGPCSVHWHGPQQPASEKTLVASAAKLPNRHVAAEPWRGSCSCCSSPKKHDQSPSKSMQPPYLRIIATPHAPEFQILSLWPPHKCLLFGSWSHRHRSLACFSNPRGGGAQHVPYWGPCSATAFYIINGAAEKTPVHQTVSVPTSGTHYQEGSPWK